MSSRMISLPNDEMNLTVPPLLSDLDGLLGLCNGLFYVKPVQINFAWLGVGVVFCFTPHPTPPKQSTLSR